ncbi:MAG: two-component system histidine kinase PnpS [Alkalibacterium gilvum]|uniref:two-component system histidine kinase PnpS n=1 Tax=Alkalibacterium TaxID=99906 RepID=UPI002648AD4C|nr:ATP-binding protein [Alkalibacterium sp.]MDN6293873.1 ATP-binding protein [Alkalibacterium sp.]MDN6295203.1 ATP-binding protein [Alkalibacterium sp.]
MKKIQSRMILFFTLILLTFFVVFISMISSGIKEQSIEQQEEALNTQLLVLGSQLNDIEESMEKNGPLISRLESASRVMKERITLIDLNGDVIYDSRVQADQLEKHLDRPEIIQVTEGQKIGTYHRKSESTNEMLYYSATRIETTESGFNGYLRLSRNAEEVIGVTDELMTTLLLFLIAAILISYLFIRYWAKKITRPIDKIRNIANVLSYQDYSVRYHKGSYKEIDELGSSINELAINLNNQMSEIKENELKLKELINNLIIGVMLVEKDKRINMVNPAMNELLGEDLNSKQGKSFFESLHSSELIATIEKAYNTERIQNREIQMYYPEEKTMDVHVVPIFNDSLETLNFIVLLYDITEIRRLEKVRTDFVANVSHELRTPITALKGFSETLLDGALDDNDVLVEFLEIINKEAGRLDVMVNDILQLSKLEQRQDNGAKDIINVNETIEDVLKVLSQKISLKDIHVNIVGQKGIEIEINPDHLKQIIINLVSNAVAYTSEKGKVTIEIGITDNNLKLSVVDNGMGIPENQLNRIFERFYRVDKSRSRNIGGTGLGLSIVKWLVENNEGHIEVKSEVNQWTDFTVWLPISITDNNNEEN